MKKFFRLALFVVIGVLSLCLITACGNGGGSGDNNNDGGGSNDGGERVLTDAEVDTLFSSLSMPTGTYSVSLNQTIGSTTTYSETTVVKTSTKEVNWGSSYYVKDNAGDYYYCYEREENDVRKQFRRKCTLEEVEEKIDDSNIIKHYLQDNFGELAQQGEAIDLLYGEGTSYYERKVTATGSGEYIYYKIEYKFNTLGEEDFLVDNVVSANIDGKNISRIEVVQTINEKMPQPNVSEGNEIKISFELYSNGGTSFPTINLNAYTDETRENVHIYYSLSDYNVNLTIEDEPVSHEEVAVNSTKTLPIPTCTGTNLTFDGWVDDDGNKVGDSIKIGYSDVYLYATWKSSTTVELNGGEITSDIKTAFSTSARYNEFFENEDFFVKPGYAFGGVYKDAAFTQAADGALLAENAKLYVKWNKCTVITPVTNANDIILPKLYVSEGEEVLPTEIQRKGFVLEGWYTDAALSKPINNNVLNVTVGAADFSIYAKYTAMNCITFEMGDFENNFKLKYLNVPKTETSEYTISDILEETYKFVAGLDFRSESQESLAFVGWYKDQGFTQKFDSYPTSNLTIYPKKGQKQFMTIDYGAGSRKDASIVNYSEYYQDWALNSIVAGMGENEYSSYSDWYFSFDEFLNKKVANEIAAPENKKVEGFYLDAALTQSTSEITFPLEALTVYVKYKDIIRINLVSNFSDDLSLTTTSYTSVKDMVEGDYEEIRKDNLDIYPSFYQYFVAQIGGDVSYTMREIFKREDGDMGYYDFVGLYIDPNMTIEFGGADDHMGWTNNARTVYAKFKIVSKVIIDIGETIDEQYSKTHEIPVTQESGTYPTLNELLEKNVFSSYFLPKDYCVEGYYMDKDFTNPYVATTDYPVDDRLTIYVKKATSPVLNFISVDPDLDGRLDNNGNSVIYRTRAHNDIPAENLKEIMWNMPYSNYEEMIIQEKILISTPNSIAYFYSDAACENEYVPSEEFPRTGTINIYVKFIDVIV